PDLPVEDDQQVEIGVEAQHPAAVAAERAYGEGQRVEIAGGPGDVANQVVDPIGEPGRGRRTAVTAPDVGGELVPCRREHGRRPILVLFRVSVTHLGGHFATADDDGRGGHYKLGQELTGTGPTRGPRLPDRSLLNLAREGIEHAEPDRILALAEHAL